MPDGLAIGGTLIAFAGIFLGLRLGYFNNKILELRKHAKELSEEAISQFEAIIYKRLKKERDPQVALSFASQYFSWERIVEELSRFHCINRREVGVDIAALIAAGAFALLNYENIVWTSFTTGHAVIAVAFVLYGGYAFVESIIEINKTEDKLGIGK